MKSSAEQAAGGQPPVDGGRGRLPRRAPGRRRPPRTRRPRRRARSASARAEPSESHTAAITANPTEILAIATGEIRHAIARRTTGPTYRRLAGSSSAVMRIFSLPARHEVSPAYLGVHSLSWISTPGHAGVKSGCDGDADGGGGAGRRRGHQVRRRAAQAVAHPGRKDAGGALRRAHSPRLPASTRPCWSCPRSTTSEARKNRRRPGQRHHRGRRHPIRLGPQRARVPDRPLPGGRDRRPPPRRGPARWSPSRSSRTARPRWTSTTRSAPPSRPRTRSWWWPTASSPASRRGKPSTARRPPRASGWRPSRRAHALAAADPAFTPTDDCGVVLRYLPDVPVHIVQGSERNIKVTYPSDLPIAEALLADART